MMRAIPVLFMAASVSYAASTSLVFDSSYDYTEDFSPVTNGNSFGPLQEGADTYLRLYSVNSTSTFVYDADGSGPGISNFTVNEGESLSVSTQIRFAGSGTSGSFGFIFASSQGTFLNLVNYNTSAANDMMRIFSDAGLGGDAGDLEVSNGSNNVIDGNTFTTVTATYTLIDADSYRFDWEIGGQTLSHTVDGAAPLEFIQVGMRAYNPMSGDSNLDINIVPEPGAAALAVFGCIPLFIRRRKG